MTPLQQQIQDQAERCFLLAEQKLNHRFPRPNITFTQKGRAAGSAHLHRNELRFNAILLKENPQEFLTEIVAHEVSHLIAFYCYGKTKPHGKEWQTIMIEIFRLPPKVTHQLDTKSIQNKTYSYQCDCQTHKLTLRRHNKIQRKQVQYVCRQCQKALTASCNEIKNALHR